MSYDILPDELIDAIVKGLPIQQRIGLRLVSTRWLSVIEGRFKNETTLTIRSAVPENEEAVPENEEADNHEDLIRGMIDGNIPRMPVSVQTINRNQLRCLPTRFRTAKPKEQLVVRNWSRFNDMLGRLFPSLADLAIVVCDNETVENLAKLIKNFQPTLKAFSLAIDQLRHHQKIVLDFSVAEAINSLPVLTELLLYAYNGFYGFPFAVAPALGRIEKFSYDDGEIHGSQSPLLSKFLSPRCTHLAINMKHLGYNDTNFNFTDQNNQAFISSSLTKLDLKWCKYDVIEQVCKNYPQLQSLTVFFRTNDYHVRAFFC